MGITVLFFGQLSDVTGARSLEMETPATISALKQQLYARYPGLGSVPFKVAVNTEIIEEEASLAAGSTIALLPPFSGG